MHCGMIHRAVTETILKNLTVFPAANIMGPRQVGKTTLAKHLQTLLGKPSIYLDLQDEQDLDKLASPGLFLRVQSLSITHKMVSCFKNPEGIEYE